MLTLRSCSLRRYRVAAPLPATRSEDFVRRLADHRFRPLAAHEERSYGWVSADNLLLAEFAPESLRRGHLAAFALRVDRRRVDARVLRARIDLEARARARASDDAGGPPRLGREERRRLRQELYQEMLRATPPTVAAWTVLLDEAERLLCFFHLGRSGNEILRVLFRDTFGSDLVPLTPWRCAQEILEGRGAPGALGAAVRTDLGTAPAFARGGVR